MQNYGNINQVIERLPTVCTVKSETLSIMQWYQICCRMRSLQFGYIYFSGTIDDMVELGGVPPEERYKSKY